MMFFISSLLSLFFSWAGEFQSLQDVELKTLGEIQKEARVAILFQRGCLSCRQQIKDLSCIRDNSKIVVVGAFSSRKELRKEYLKMGSRFKGYFASHEALKKLNILSNITPQIIDLHDLKQPPIVGKRKCSKIERLVGKI